MTYLKSILKRWKNNFKYKKEKF